MTPSEAVLWRSLRRRRLDGLDFRRQHPLGRFVVDFYCAACRLAVELDGSVHQEPEQRHHDAERQLDLEAEGITVLRFTNEQVETQLPSVLAAIAAEAQRLRASAPSST